MCSHTSANEISINSWCGMPGFHAFMCDLFLPCRCNWFLSDIYFINFFMLGLHWSNAAFAPWSHIRWHGLSNRNLQKCRRPGEDGDLLQSGESTPATYRGGPSWSVGNFRLVGSLKLFPLLCILHRPLLDCTLQWLRRAVRSRDFFFGSSHAASLLPCKTSVSSPGSQQNRRRATRNSSRENWEGNVKGSMTRVGKEPAFVSRLVSGPTPRQARNAAVDQPAAKNG